ncbi:MAG TPA: hypothetical protein VHE30_20400 [Polyangiaceae bacterium]|nr:hypothetical protein [Polyangiaceae bacterium]
MRTHVIAAATAACLALLPNCGQKADTDSSAPPHFGTGSAPSGGGTPGAGGGNGGSGGSNVGGDGPGAGGAGNGTSSGGAESGGTGNEPGNGGTVGAGGDPPATGGFTQCSGNLQDPSLLPPCSTCSGGRCVASADYPNAPASILDSCGQDMVCMPDSIVATQGNVLLPSCRSVANMEGRCASMCIPIVRSLSGVLPQGGCGPDDRCAPCYNPADGSSTGICNVGCDPGPTDAPFRFPDCCAGVGRCVPRAALPNVTGASQLPQVDCASSNDACVPTKLVTDPTYRFPSCTFLSQPGVCMPSCIVDQIPMGSLLQRGDCADSNDKCVLCTNPTTGQPTGACPP